MHPTDIDLRSVYRSYTSMIMNNKQFGSCNSRTASSSIVFVQWNSDIFARHPISSSNSGPELRPAKINFLCDHVVTIKNEDKTHLLVSLSWFQVHPKNTNFGKPVTVWCSNLFEPYGIHSLIPVQFIRHRAVALKDRLDGETVLFVTPTVE